jgi:hypothetical protein
MAQEPSSTVKHVNWIWPDCLVGDGTTGNSDRGAYNVFVPNASTYSKGDANTARFRYVKISD